MNKIRLWILSIILIILIVLSTEKVYAANNKIKLYEYNYNNNTHSNVSYDNKGVISGLNPFHLYAEYPADSTATFEWRITDATKNIAVITGRTSSKIPNKNISTVIGLKEGDATIKVTAIVKGKEVSTAYCNVNVKSTSLDKKILESLYREDTKFSSLPDASDIIRDFNKTSAAHPRIMADGDDFRMIQKYIEYANGLEYGFDTEYKQMVKKEIDELYDGENISNEYWQYMRILNQTITGLADKKVKDDINYVYTLIDGAMADYTRGIEEEVEICAFCYRISKAYMENVKSYKEYFSSIEAYENEYACALSTLEENYGKAERVISILTDYAEFPDWNPSNFIDVGIISYDFALGYDWVYDYMTDEQKEFFENVLLERGVQDCRSYMRSITGQQRFRSNWSAVIYSGCGTAAMAVFESDPELCSNTIADLSRFLPILINQMAPDGGFSEGITYWTFSWRYMGYLLSSLSCTFGEDYGLTEVAGAKESMYFPIYMKGNPTTADYFYQFNYGDAMEYANSANSVLLWLCNAYSKKVDFFSETQLFTWYILQYTDPLKYGAADIQDLLWLPPLLLKYGNRLKPPNAITGKDLSNLGIQNYRAFFGGDKIPNNILIKNNLMSDTVTYGRGDKVNLITYSQDITDKYSAGFFTKDSNTKTSHRDMDAGNFIFDALGVRWAWDWGKTTYAGRRYDYYVKRAEGHNTLVINPSAGDDQNNNTAAKITGSSTISKDDCSINVNGGYVVYDMSNSYNLTTFKDGSVSRNANSVQRGFKLIDNGSRLLIQDELILENPSDVYWFLQTPVLENDFDISADGRSVILTQTNIDGKKVHLKAELKVTSDNSNICPVFTAMEYRTLSPELMKNSVNKEFYRTHSDKRKLSIHVSQDAKGKTVKISKATIAVVLTPIYDNSDYDAVMPKIIPLRKWMPKRKYPVTELSVRNKSTGKAVTTLYPDSKKPINLSAVIQPAYATNRILRWTSSDKKLAVVDKNGVVKPLKTGTVKITASTTDGSNISVTVKLVNNIKIPLKNITFKRTEMRLNADSSATLKLSYSPQDTTDGTSVVWKNSNPQVAYVNIDDIGYTKTVMAKSAGTTTITAKMGKLMVSCRVIVRPKRVSFTAERKKAQSRIKFAIDSKDSTKVKYEIYSSSSQNGKYKKVKSTSDANPSIAAEKGKKMYYKVRAYIQVDSVKYYSPYSKELRI